MDGSEFEPLGTASQPGCRHTMDPMARPLDFAIFLLRSWGTDSNGTGFRGQGSFNSFNIPFLKQDVLIVPCF